MTSIALMRILRALEEREEYPNVFLSHFIFSEVISACPNRCAANAVAHGNHGEGIGDGTRKEIINDDIVDTALEVLNCGTTTLGGGGA